MAGLLSALYFLENLEKGFVFTKWENFWMRGGSGGRPIGRGNDSHADGWADAPPIVVVAKSAQLRFRLRRKLRPLPCSSSPHRAGRGGGPFWSCQKRNGPCTVQREKTLRRVGLRKRSPPAAGGGWLAVPCGSQRRKRVALGVTLGPGKSGIHPAPLFAAAGLVVDGASATGR